MFDKTVFVVEGPPGTIDKRVGARYAYGPLAEGNQSFVQFADANGQRVHHISADDPPVEHANTITWDNRYGDWLIRPLKLDDQEWALVPSLRFISLDDFRAHCEKVLGTQFDQSSST